MKEVLVKVRELLSDEKRWTQIYYARDADGREVSPLNERAVCWCLLGAFHKLGVLSNEDGIDTLTELRVACNTSIISFNDCSTHADVLKLLDEEIAR